MTEKTCTKCAITKPITEYGLDASFKDGYRGACKTCRRAQLIARRPPPGERKSKYGPGMHLCSKCRSVLPASEFHANHTRSTGISSTCKTCAIEGHYAWRKANPDRYREIVRKGARKYVAKRRAIAAAAAALDTSNV